MRELITFSTKELENGLVVLKTFTAFTKSAHKGPLQARMDIGQLFSHNDSAVVDG